MAQTYHRACNLSFQFYLMMTSISVTLSGRSMVKAQLQQEVPRLFHRIRKWFYDEDAVLVSVHYRLFEPTSIKYYTLMSKDLPNCELFYSTTFQDF